MSGGTAFTRTTYFKVGPVDPWYRGHGAFADTDFHQKAFIAGCKFVDLKIPELHLHHDRIDGERSLDHMEYMRLGLNNFIYYVRKWGLPKMYAEDMAYKLGVFQAKKYVTERFAQLEDSQLQPVASNSEMPAFEDSVPVGEQT